jgi:co-chaperonin GroES (HSP10)
MQRIMVADKVLIKRMAPEEVTSGGLYIPEDQRTPRDLGVIVAIGLGSIKADGTRNPLTAEIGDIIPLPKRLFGMEIEVEGDTYIICREFELPMILRDDLKSEEE